MTPEELAELKSLCEKATPGPWAVGMYDKPFTYFFMVDRTRLDGCPLDEDTANADFISAARTAIPKLIAEIARLNAEIAGLRAAIGRTVSYPPMQRHPDDPVAPQKYKVGN